MCDCEEHVSLVPYASPTTSLPSSCHMYHSIIMLCHVRCCCHGRHTRLMLCHTHTHQGVRHQLCLPVHGQNCKNNGKVARKLAKQRAQLYNIPLLAKKAGRIPTVNQPAAVQSEWREMGCAWGVRDANGCDMDVHVCSHVYVVFSCLLHAAWCMLYVVWCMVHVSCVMCHVSCHVSCWCHAHVHVLSCACHSVQLNVESVMPKVVLRRKSGIDPRRISRSEHGVTIHAAIIHVMERASMHDDGNNSYSSKSNRDTYVQRLLPSQRQHMICRCE